MRADEAIIRTLDAEDVDTAFALMAEDTMHLLSELKEHWTGEVRVVESRHEQGAVGMADGYARASDDVGVCVVGRGPGIAQTGTSLVTARKRGSPLLVLVPEPKLSATYDSKRFEQEAYLRATVGEVASVRSPGTLLPILRESFRRLRTGEGPVAVQIAWDVLEGEVEDPGDLNGRGPTRPEGSRPRLQPDGERIEEAVDAYLDSDATKAPVVLAGRGAVASDAKDALEELAERTNALLATTLQARGYFSDHPYSLGFAGEWGGNLTNEYLTEADCVFAVGCSLNPHTTDHGYLVDGATLIQVDADPSAFGEYTPIDVGIEADAREAADALAAELDDLGIDRSGTFWTDRLERRIAETPALDEGEFPEQSGRMDPRDLVRTLDRVLPEDRLVVTDGGHFTRWVVDGITTPSPDDFVWTLDFSAIGQGLSAGIGAALADGRPCVAFCGDAGFMMALQEVETAARNDVPITVVVMNDAALGSEYHNLAPSGGYAEAALVDSPDLADTARSLGAEGATFRDAGDLEALAGEVVGRDGPLVVDCKVNREVRHRSKS